MTEELTDVEHAKKYAEESISLAISMYNPKAEEIARMACLYGLTYKNNKIKELQEEIKACKFAMAMSEKVEKQLREQIEKMKRCGNCKYGYCGGSSISIDKNGNRTFHNWNEEKQEYCDIGKNGKYQCWELAE